ncbi:hybrid-cluster NAD(P)-dependent oxidoreductase [Cereibacter sphaeroides]|nr:hybrid-cluster NAD(P)-dependent oxidoreductase [Cereibacter sphaeroides]
MKPKSGNWTATPWDDAELLECTAVVVETPDTYTFAFRAPSGAWFDYQPGQFVTLDLPVDPKNVPGGNVQRTYTISSSPSRPLSISVTVKAQTNSIGTRWMLDHLKPGMKLKAYGPAGIFTSQRHKADKYLFISAGSGITPMMSMTTWAWDFGAADITFVHAARRPSDIIFRERLENFVKRMPGLELRFVVEEPDPLRAWYGYQGRLNQIMLGLMAPDYLEREVFCCGPEPFMQAVREMLIALGYDMDRYHQESFGGEGVKTEAEAPVLDDVIPDEDTGAEVTFAASGVSARCTQTDTVLAVAKGAGLNIPSGCTFGLCGTCKVKKLSGEVHMVHNGGITDEDIEDGYILACCSNPMGKVTVAV